MHKKSALFIHLVNHHQQAVYSKAVYMLGNAVEAEDACQETYERLWKRISAKAEHSSAEERAEEDKAWLLRVTHNLCIDKLRQRKPMSIDSVQESVCESPTSQPATALASSQLSDWLSNAIDRLKEPYKSLIVLADLQQMTVREVADTLDLSENQVKVYVHRARKQLRGLLQGIEL